MKAETGKRVNGSCGPGDIFEFFRREVLPRLDIRAAHAAMRTEFTKDTPTAGGWLECWSRDRPHGDHPTAAVNVGGGKDRGYYRDAAGSGERLDLLDYAVKYGGLRTLKGAIAF